jgi:type I restriction enzyme R subunit
MNEADTCRQYVDPKLSAAGWDETPHSVGREQTFTDGRVFVRPDRQYRRGEKRRVDYLLRYTRDFPIAVVEAKAGYKSASDGLGQARGYAEALGLRFAYSTNGSGIVEFDFATGAETERSEFPTPAELIGRIKQEEGLDDRAADQLLEGFYVQPGRKPRYYQEIAINRVVQSLVQGRDRVLVTMATGTGKTVVAFQVCWKLWNAKWNRKGDPARRPRILYLADRNILIDDPKNKTFTPFGDARHKIEGGEIVKSREMYFAIYQAIAEDERRPGLYKEYAPDFFDLIIIDECHRGSARSDSSWRRILEYFQPAAQFGMTATPLREDNRDTYDYFGNPIYTYSLRQGIEDGFLAPYRVHRIVTTADATGWRPTRGELDRFGREIPDDEYQTKDFERVVALRSRTRAIARHLFQFLQRTDPMAKTLVFCVDQEHAQEMRSELQKLLAQDDPERARKYPNYVVRVTADEGDIGRGHLSRFQELETEEPVILTSSQLLTTGVDAKMVKNVALARVVGSMSEFKQIIGRGTRIDEDYGKLWFSILDYTGSATSHFADPEFDGEPDLVEETQIDDKGEEIEDGLPADAGSEQAEPDPDEPPEGHAEIDEPPSDGAPRKLYVDRDAGVGIAHEVTQDLDAEGRLLTVTEFIDYTAGRVRSLCRDPEDLLDRWLDGHRRREILDELADRGVDFDALAEAAGQPDADPFDLLCHLAFSAPLRTRRERAERVRKEKTDLFDAYGAEAKAVLLDILLKYEDHGAGQFDIPGVLKVPPISERGNVGEIIQMFGGADRLRTAVDQLQTALYVA